MSASSPETRPPSPRPRLSVAAPCYNEAAGIAEVVKEWDAILAEQPFASEIVICNDGSTDGSGDLLHELAGRVERLRVVELAANGGYGKALASAIDACHGELVVTIDSDGQFDLGDARQLMDAFEEGGFDLVTGYRSSKQDTPFRVLANHGLNGLVRLLFGVRLRDSNCAIKLARTETLRGLHLESRGWSTPTEICLRLHARGARIGEVAVGHRERTLGTSKLHPIRTAWAMFRFLLYLRAKLSLHRSRILIEP